MIPLDPVILVLEAALIDRTVTDRVQAFKNAPERCCKVKGPFLSVLLVM